MFQRALFVIEAPLISTYQYRYKIHAMHPSDVESLCGRTRVRGYHSGRARGFAWETKQSVTCWYCRRLLGLHK